MTMATLAQKTPIQQGFDALSSNVAGTGLEPATFGL